MSYFTKEQDIVIKAMIQEIKASGNNPELISLIKVSKIEDGFKRDIIEEMVIDDIIDVAETHDITMNESNIKELASQLKNELNNSNNEGYILDRIYEFHEEN